MSERMREKEAQWGKYGSANVLDEIETTFAIWNSCLAIGMEFDQTLSHGARNTAVHSDLNDLVAEGLYGDIATTLYKDLHDLPRTMAIDLLEYMRATLIELRDKWYDIDEDETNKLSWFPTNALRDEHRDCKKSEKDTARRKHEADVARGTFFRT
ncbi:hypothetical protein MMC29_004539 [Sticta canariensis]|nr:hypothetical protein [Sticta canariensis]